jgi:hypothetical protein
LTLQQQFRRLGRHPRGFYQQQPDIVQDKLGIPTVSRESKEDAITQMARKGPGEHTPQHPPSSKDFSPEKSPKEKIPGVCSTKKKQISAGKPCHTRWCRLGQKTQAQVGASQDEPHKLGTNVQVEVDELQASN